MWTEIYEGYINHPMQTYATSRCTSVLHLEAPRIGYGTLRPQALAATAHVLQPDRLANAAFWLQRARISSPRTPHPLLADEERWAHTFPDRTVHPLWLSTNPHQQILQLQPRMKLAAEELHRGSSLQTHSASPMQRAEAGALIYDTGQDLWVDLWNVWIRLLELAAPFST